MIQNIIFDMGGVLITWDPAHFIDRAGVTDPADRDLLMRAIYRSPNWPRQDAGEIDEAEVERRARAMLPERLHAVAHDLIFHWETPSEPIPGMAEFVRDCKAAGLGVYLLSNASVRQPEYWPGIPGSECFDGAVISALERCVKPGAEIFQVLLDRYRLKAEECLFVDDVKENVEGAEKVGLNGFWFQGDVEALRMRLSIDHRSGPLNLHYATEDDLAEVARTWPSEHRPISEAEARAVVDRLRQNYARNHSGSVCHLCLAVCKTDDPQTFIGWCGLDGSRSQTEPEIFILLDAEYRSKGFGTQCVKELLRIAADDFSLRSVHGGCAKENIASARAMEKGGMTLYGREENGDPLYRLCAKK